MLKKLKSVKTWVLIWTVSVITFIVVYDRSSFVTLAQNLAFVVLGYVGCNVWQKQIFANQEKKGYFNEPSKFDTEGKMQ